MCFTPVWLKTKQKFTFRVNYLDIAPLHASVIMGVSNTFGTLAGIFSPIVTGYIVTTPVI